MQAERTGMGSSIAGRMIAAVLSLISTVLLGVVLSSPCQASPEARPLPADGVLGLFKPSALPRVVIDDQEVLLGAGAQIRNQQNLIIQTGAIAGGPDVHILYKRNIQGQIERIWMLTDAEFQRISSGGK